MTDAVYSYFVALPSLNQLFTAGKILPPPNFKKYRPIHLVGAPTEEDDVDSNPLTVDMFGQPIKRIHEHSRIFLSSKLNCPTYAKVFEKIKEAMDATHGRSVKLATLVSAHSKKT